VGERRQERWIQRRGERAVENACRSQILFVLVELAHIQMESLLGNLKAELLRLRESYLESDTVPGILGVFNIC
jgi:hypothetical protein